MTALNMAVVIGILVWGIARPERVDSGGSSRAAVLRRCESVTWNLPVREDALRITAPSGWFGPGSDYLDAMREVGATPQTHGALPVPHPQESIPTSGTVTAGYDTTSDDVVFTASISPSSIPGALLYVLAGVVAIAIALTQWRLLRLVRRSLQLTTGHGGHAAPVPAPDGQESGWPSVIAQVAAEVFAAPVAFTREGDLLDIATDPAPHFTVAVPDGRHLIFTTQPRAFASVAWARRLDSGQGAEIHSVWNVLMYGAQTHTRTAIPRGAAWFLLVVSGHPLDQPASWYGRVWMLVRG
jgi:hypothetical protein